MPYAIPRSSWRKFAAIKLCVEGSIKAAPSPWTAREAMRAAPVDARPHASDAAVKMKRPSKNIRRRPTKSASFPPVSRNPAYTSRNALTVHSSLARLSFRSVWIAGNATFTIVVSTMTMKRLAVTAASVHHLRLPSISAPAMSFSIPHNSGMI
jgi:hypothetical protein